MVKKNFEIAGYEVLLTDVNIYVHMFKTNCKVHMVFRHSNQIRLSGDSKITLRVLS